jgi:transcriptional regulator of acetoin/glycerol metabolism
VAVCPGSRVRLADLPVLSLDGERRAGEAEQLSGGTFEALERRILKRAIEHAGGNKSEAARLLGLKRTTFLDKLKRHGIETGGQARGRA